MSTPSLQSIMRPLGGQRVRFPATVAIVLLVLVVSNWFFSPASVAHAQTPRSYRVQAHVLASGDIEASMRVSVSIPEALRELRLWVYPDRLAVVPSAMDGHSAPWVYPGQIDRGGLSIDSLSVDGTPTAFSWERGDVGAHDGRDFRGADLLVPVEPGTARRLEVRIRFHLRVPQRFGRLGRVGSRLTMVAPWYPLVLSADGSYRQRVPHHVQIDAAPEAHVLVADERFVGEAETTVEAAFAPVAIFPELYLRRRRIHGVEVAFAFPRRPYDPPTASSRGLERLRDLVRIDTVGLMSTVVEQVLTTVEQADVPVAVASVNVVTVPLRTELTGTAPGMVLVSDRLYEVFPADVIRDFHNRAFRRALLRHLVEPVSERVDAPRDRDWADDVRAVVLGDLDAARRRHTEQSTEDIARWASFHPSVDQLLYAPQISFSDVFFGSVDEPDFFRDDPARARWPQARGRRIVESARDALGPEAMDGFVRRLVQGHVGVREALRETEEISPDTTGGAADQELDMWLEIPAMEVNYRLGEVSTQRLPSGQYQTRVEVIRDGAARHEPVEVQVTDDSGARAQGRWDGRGDHGVVTIQTDHPYRSAMLDPRGRLTQSPRVADGHPRRDDMSHLPWRPPLLQGFNLAANATEGTLSGFVDFALRRKYDLDSTFTGFFSRSDLSIGGAVGYAHGIGPKLDGNNRSGSFSASLSLRRMQPLDVLNQAGVRERQPGGYRVGLGLGTHFNRVRYLIDPRSGHSIGGSVTAAMTRRDDGSLTFHVNTAIRGHLTLSIGLRNVFVMAGGVSWTFGSALASERPSVGGPTLLRGYEPGELAGDGRAFAVVEHRWTVLSDLSWNVLHLAWLREIQLAAFAGAGLVVHATDGRMLAPAAEVGGGVRFLFEYGGIQPAVLVADVGVPLVRSEAEQRQRTPYGLHIGFEQYF